MAREWLWLLGSYIAGFCLWLLFLLLFQSETGAGAFGSVANHPAAGMYFAFTLGLTVAVYLVRGIWWAVRRIIRRPRS